VTTTHPSVTAHATELRASGIREIFNLAANKPDCLHLELGEPDFPTPAHIVEAAVDSARTGSRYTPTIGLPLLREAIAARLDRVHGLDVSPDHVIVTQGGSHAVALLVEAVVGEGDEVLVPDPGWPNCAMGVVAHGGRPVPYALRPEAGFVPDPDEVASLITPRTKLLVLNSPSNPTGSVFPQEVVTAIVADANKRGVLVLSDEVYDEIVFDGQAPVGASHLDGVIGVWSFSKSYAMTGWRVGYVAAPASLLPTMSMIQEGTITCVSSITQAAALAALDGPQSCVTEMRDAYERRRDLAVDSLTASGIDHVAPSGAFYLMVHLGSGVDARAAALDLVAQGVAVAPGTAFGSVASEYLRVSLAASEETIAAAIARLTRSFQPR
jgi:aspartate aminotransferase